MVSKISPVKGPSVDCTVRNLSPAGGLLFVDNGYSLPSICRWIATVGAASRNGVGSTASASNSNRLPLPEPHKGTARAVR